MYLDFTHLDFLFDKVYINLDVLGTLVLYQIRGEIYSTDIVAIDNSGRS